MDRLETHTQSKSQNRLKKSQIGLDRKDSHLEICLKDAVDFRHLGQNGFEHYRFDHDSLPELDSREIDLRTEVFGKTLSAPILVGAMTGGTQRAGEINRRLALAAEKTGVGFALGSQRKMLGDSSVRVSFAVKDFAPDLPLLIGNLGAVQLNYGVGTEQVQKLVREADCDAFAFHLNPLQEMIQPEGDTNFSSLLPKLKETIPSLGVPVLVKEVGAGISETTAKKLRDLPLSGVETAGRGGTSWSKIEALRNSDPIKSSVGRLFAQWGVSTVESLQVCQRNLGDLQIICSGGMKNGIEVAKAVAMGAKAAAFAMPMLKAAEESSEKVVGLIEQIKEELRTVLFVTGCRTPEELRSRPLRKLTDLTTDFS